MTSPEGITTYNYVASVHGRNQIESIVYNNSQESYVTSESYAYDNFSRANSKTEVIHGETFVNTMVYDNYNRVTQEVYPSGLVIKNEYDDISSLTRVTNGDETIEIFKATASNAYGQLTEYDLGNGTSSIMDYNIYGLPTRFRSTGTGVFDMTFTMDERNGNLISRSDAIVGETEMFTYDNHDRLKTMEVFSRPLDKVTLNYEANGNIQSKSDVSTQDYIYDTNKIHAISSIPSPMPISALDQQISYNSAQQPTDINEGAGDGQYNLHYEYGTDQNRRYARLTKGDDPLTEEEIYQRYYVGSYERNIQGGVTRDIHYLGMGVMVVQEDGGAFDYYYSYADYQGSILAVTDDTGAVVARQSFDAWGRKRNAQDWTNQGVANYELPWLYRGYTGHEMLPEFDLINMNGRLYDNHVARMLSPDHYAGQDGSSQGYNRYSYVYNNPLRYNDPSGMTGVVCAQLGVDPNGGGITLGATITGTPSAPAAAGTPYNPTGVLTSVGTNLAGQFFNFDNDHYNDAGGSSASSDQIIIRGANNSSITVNNEYINFDVSVEGLGIDFGGNYELDGDEILHSILDIVGIGDQTGTADAINAGLYLDEGRYWDALQI